MTWQMTNDNSALLKEYRSSCEGISRLERLLMKHCSRFIDATESWETIEMYYRNLKTLYMEEAIIKWTFIGMQVKLFAGWSSEQMKLIRSMDLSLTEKQHRARDEVSRSLNVVVDIATNVDALQSPFSELDRAAKILSENQDAYVKGLLDACKPSINVAKNESFEDDLFRQLGHVEVIDFGTFGQN